jgi:hypothetical protein
MATALQVLRSVAGALLIIFGLVIFGRDSVVRARRGKRLNARWLAVVALKNESPGWGFWVGMASVLIGILLLPI